MNGPAAVAQEEVSSVNQQATAICHVLACLVALKREPQPLCGSDEPIT
jgi:hypothetical protein